MRPGSSSEKTLSPDARSNGEQLGLFPSRERARKACRARRHRARPVDVLCADPPGLCGHGGADRYGISGGTAMRALHPLMLFYGAMLAVVVLIWIVRVPA
jgi:hypothetical protein